MTQTIHDETCNTENLVSVDVYYHPNSADKRNIENGSAKYRYTVSAYKFSRKEAIAYCAERIEESFYNYNDDISEDIQKIRECFNIATNKEYIWKTCSENGHDDYGSFFAEKEDAAGDLYNQMC